MENQPISPSVAPNPMSSMPPAATMPTVPAPSAPSKKKFPLAIIAGVVIVLLLVIGTGLAYYYQQMGSSNKGNSLYGNNTSNNGNAVPTVTNSGNGMTQEEIKAEDNRLFFVDGANSDIYMFDISTMKSEKLTNFTSQGTVLGQVIDDNTFGYSVCGFTVNDYSCEFFTLSLSDKKVTKVTAVDPAMEVTSAAWKSANIFAYNGVLAKSNDLESLVLYNNGPSKTFEGRTGTTQNVPHSQGGDNVELAFSPDGKYLAKTNTHGVKENDFATYVYGLENDKKITIAEANFPLWKDNTTLLYSSSKADRTKKVFSYNVETGAETVLAELTRRVDSFSLLNDKLVYSSPSDQATYIYDLATKTEKQVTNNGYYAQWVNKNNVVYFEDGWCTPGDNECEPNELPSKLKLYNVVTGTTTDVGADITGEERTFFFKGSR